MNTNDAIELDIAGKHTDGFDFTYTHISKVDLKHQLEQEKINRNSNLWIGNNFAKPSTIIYIFLFDAYTFKDIARENNELETALARNGFPTILKVEIDETNYYKN